jgi:hypothetical protein
MKTTKRCGLQPSKTVASLLLTKRKNSVSVLRYPLKTIEDEVRILSTEPDQQIPSFRDKFYNSGTTKSVLISSSKYDSAKDRAPKYNCPVKPSKKAQFKKCMKSEI